MYLIIPLMGFNKSNDELCESKGGSKYPLMDFSKNPLMGYVNLMMYLITH